MPPTKSPSSIEPNRALILDLTRWSPLPVPCESKRREDASRCMVPAASSQEVPSQNGMQSTAQPLRQEQQAQHLVLRRNWSVRTPSMQRAKVWRQICVANQGSFFVNEMDMNAPTIKHIKLSDGGSRMLNTPNAGGNSVASEVMSFELVKALFGAELLKTEMEIDYRWFGYSITDYSVRMNENIVGVSVARAMKYKGIFDLEDARRLLNKKLNGVIRSSENACGPLRWNKQILHLWAEHAYIVDVLAECYQTIIPEAVRHNTVVVVTVCTTNWIYH